MIKYRFCYAGAKGSRMIEGAALPRPGDVIHVGPVSVVVRDVRFSPDDTPLAEVWGEQLAGKTDSAGLLTECTFVEIGSARIFRVAFLPSPPPVGTLVMEPEEPRGVLEVRRVILDNDECGNASYRLSCRRLSDDESTEVLDEMWTGSDAPKSLPAPN